MSGKGKAKGSGNEERNKVTDNPFSKQLLGVTIDFVWRVTDTEFRIRSALGWRDPPHRLPTMQVIWIPAYRWEDTDSEDSQEEEENDTDYYDVDSESPVAEEASGEQEQEQQLVMLKGTVVYGRNGSVVGHLVKAVSEG